MVKITKHLADLIGKTPLSELTNYNKINNLKATFIAKLMYFNPICCVRDRISFSMIEKAEIF